ATTLLRKEARQLRDAAAIARAEAEARRTREDDATENTILQHVARVLADGGRICARCLARDAGITPEDVKRQLLVIAARLRTTADYGTCRACRRQDKLFSFGGGESAPQNAPDLERSGGGETSPGQ